MEELQIFNNEEFGNVRSLVIDNEPWLVGKDVAEALGYKNVYVCTDGHRNDENSHGWAEINGRVYDPLFAEAKSYSRNYGVRYGVYPLSPVMRVKIA